MTQTQSSINIAFFSQFIASHPMNILKDNDLKRMARENAFFLIYDNPKCVYNGLWSYPSPLLSYSPPTLVDSLFPNPPLSTFMHFFLYVKVLCM